MAALRLPHRLGSRVLRVRRKQLCLNATEGNPSSPQLFGEQAIAQSCRSSNCNLTLPPYQELLSKITRISGMRLRHPSHGLQPASYPPRQRGPSTARARRILTRRASEGTCWRGPRRVRMLQGTRSAAPLPLPTGTSSQQIGTFQNPRPAKPASSGHSRFGLDPSISYNKNSGLSALLTTSLSRRRWRPFA